MKNGKPNQAAAGCFHLSSQIVVRLEFPLTARFMRADGFS
jgi:hypothetical protein